MGRWKLRDPAIYPIHFSDVVLNSYDTKSPQLLESFPTRQAALSRLERFREWRYCVRNNPGRHRCLDIELGSRIATQIKIDKKSPVNPVQAWVTVKPLLIDSIVKFNPHLFDLIQSVLSDCQPETGSFILPIPIDAEETRPHNGTRTGNSALPEYMETSNG